MMKNLSVQILSLLLFSLFPLAADSQEIIDVVRAGNFETVKAMIGKEPGLIKVKSNTGETLLHIAALSGNKDISFFLLSKGADPNAKDASNNTPLTNSIRSRNFETVKVVGDNGGDVNLRGLWNFLPIQVAAEFTGADIVNYLIEKGAKVPVDQEETVYQLLRAACSKGMTLLFDKILENGFDLKVNQFSRTLLHSAASGGSVQIIETLLSRGFKPMSGDGYGWSPLHCAAEKGNLNAVKLLVSKGADVNDRNASGRTPYNLADENGHKEVCKYLISSGADSSGQRFPVLTGRYAGQKEPENSPRVFGVDIITTKYMVHGNVAFNPDFSEVYWSGYYPAGNSGELETRILGMKFRDGKWSMPEPASFSPVGYGYDSPFITPDGKKLFFVSSRPLNASDNIKTKENIWYMVMEASRWSEPRPLAIANTLSLHWQLSTDRKGNLYFGAHDPDGKRFSEIFCSKFINGEYQKPERLDTTVNSENIEGSPFISPDGDYLIYDRASQFGHQMGLYISFRTSNDSWTEGKPIAEIAGISPYSQCGRISPDGKYLFYIAGYSNEFGVYWVSTDFIGKMRTDRVSQDG
jgi:ankyrin repeat protein